MEQHEIIGFFGFLIFICGLLMLDLGVFSKKDQPVSFRSALIWTSVWVSLALLFYVLIIHYGHWFHNIDSMEDLREIVQRHKHPVNLGLYPVFEDALKAYNRNLGLEYLTGYIIEYSLSIDNIFVMIMIFMAFGIREKHYKWVLFWGILGAIVMRFIFIFVASALIHRFEWILIIFGIFLVITGVYMFVQRNKKEKIDPQRHPVVRFASRHFAVFPRTVGHRFFIRNRSGKLMITPLFIVLMVIEFMDVIFAVDSIPAIFSITKDPNIVFFSNIFAIIGLRSLFFLVMNIMNRFIYLKVGLAILLTVIGIKLLIPHHILVEDLGFTTRESLLLVLVIIGSSIIASLVKTWIDRRKSRVSE